jgi:hypothetical protein
LPLLKCVSKEERAYILKEIHEGVCGNHAGGRVLAHKVVRMGYFWPRMYAESIEMEMVCKCEKCQLFAFVPSIPPEVLAFISSLWPFAQLKVDIVDIVDIVGPLQNGKGRVKFTIVAMDYFIK